MQRRITVRAVIVQNGRLLAVKHLPYEGVDKATTKTWCLPGGGLDDGESLEAGVKRELMEELGLEVIVGKLLYIQQFMYGDIDKLEFFFQASTSDDIEVLLPENTTHGSVEIAEYKLIDYRQEPLLPAFLNHEDIEAAIAEEGAPKIYSYPAA